jgi:hypothetical protein
MENYLVDKGRSGRRMKTSKVGKAKCSSGIIHAQTILNVYVGVVLRCTKVVSESGWKRRTTNYDRVMMKRVKKKRRMKKKHTIEKSSRRPDDTHPLEDCLGVN